MNGSKEKLNRELLDASKRLSTQTVLFHQNVAAYLGLNITDHKCLDLVLGKGRVTAGQLAELTKLTTGAITSVLNRLEEAGYIRRVKDPADRRVVLVEPVYENLRPLHDVFGPLGEAMSELHARYRPEELRIILDYVDRACQVLVRQAELLERKSERQVPNK
ncbi:MarR family transcriptional regulator [Paenibacillus sp. 32O-W]|jgi:Transcriptional regulators|uniref:HTH-type transcriptional regulator YcgE n=1 Tax=Paenibacillus cisolokensis TaxID=1658519 RepID=A0ABQ4N9A6_9BACL|nr:MULTISPECIES: MarR family transcriptional regulator [Paenibacillus]ALS29298.1 MarR family transcriptional regulator [Paenibacillus sp. 32O-W]GIQ64533.1 putative HTH-type transcriptional regulator YcgE [Paenibacillus cisolokensis]